ncbi:phage holin family protein [Humibacillus xanthopallidus]|uniref:Putative superfamily III holin-X n=1 Tax=Humibacillus xanthopallidus TaxID=412689 RepID=A0A543HUQ5_9MICO|nr:putative superfamily III holin-X [Humibacillus xanthopallidus]
MSTHTPHPLESSPGVDGMSAEQKAETASLGDIVGDISSGLSTLMRQEVALAKAEARESASQAGKAAGLFSGAALGGWMAALFLSLAVWEWIAGAIDNRGWAAVIVMAIWAVIAAVLAAMGRTEMRRVSGLPRTVETTKRVPDALKGQETT